MNFSKELLKKTVCEYFDIDKTKLSEEIRTKEFITPRQVYFYFCKMYTSDSLQCIGKSIKRDHATVMYSVSKIKNEIEIYPEIKKAIEDILFKLNNYHSVVVEDIDLLRLTENYTNSFIITPN